MTFPSGEIAASLASLTSDASTVDCSPARARNIQVSTAREKQYHANYDQVKP